MIDVDTIREMVREEISRSVANTRVDEGMTSRRIKQGAATATGAVVFSIFAAIGVAAPVIAPIVGTLGAVGGVGSAAYLAKMIRGLSLDLYDDLESNIKKRDKLIVAASKEGDVTKYKPQLDTLSREQSVIGQKLEKAAKKDLRAGKIEQSDFDNMKNIIRQTREASLTFLMNK